ncbi:MAG: hypothetical protein A2099_07190 [Planctomycetes bacterium GWF2_39_10]|nr:MAG: hypothetical protein A2Y09_07850 [Planctomycetes bacterium GWA2_39_15]OHB47355.1 MAG: hypothetical protein A2099_07190 [Planctomycetes bacterium GWF2_39_10]
MTADIRILTLENKKEWDDLLFRCNNINLLQSWEYGEAKRNTEGWIPVRSLLLYLNKPMGVVQTLIKKIPLLGGIARINRAPLIITTEHESSIANTVVQILRFLRYYWVEQKKMILFIAPGIVQCEINEKILNKIGYHRIDKNAWTSIIIDLYSDEAILRQSLRQKWRNLLNKSERMGLTLELDNSNDGLSFLMSRYNRMMTEKNFAGPSEKLIREIKNVTSDKSSVQIMFAVKNGVRVGGIFVLGYIDTCHYLIGWNSPEGRIFQSNYLLLWHAILLFKEMGYHWFDLGGINEKLTPGITHFKRGLGGKEYTLIGEYEACPQGIFALLIGRIIKLGLKYS